MLELIIDPVCSLVFESEPSDRAAMRRPPRSIDEPLFGRRQMVFAAVQGGVLLAAVLGIYVWGLNAGMPTDSARALGFIVLVIGNLALALTGASEASTPLLDRRHLVFWVVGALAAVILASALTVPALSRIFQLSAPNGASIVAAIVVSVIAGGWYGLVRRWNPVRA
jgi:Ca2+-transporting ATPase